MYYSYNVPDEIFDDRTIIKIIIIVSIIIYSAYDKILRIFIDLNILTTDVNCKSFRTYKVNK